MYTPLEASHGMDSSNKMTMVSARLKLAYVWVKMVLSAIKIFGGGLGRLI